MKKAGKVVLIVLGSIIGLIILSVLLSKYSELRVQDINKKVDISLVENEKEDMVVDVVYTIKNKSSRTQEINSIDIEQELLDGVELVSINLDRTDEYSTLIGMRSFEFRKDVLPGEAVEVIFTFKKKDSEVRFTDTDICIGGPGRCVGRSFTL